MLIRNLGTLDVVGDQYYRRYRRSQTHRVDRFRMGPSDANHTTMPDIEMAITYLAQSTGTNYHN